jgi:hypothetical protein
LRVQNYKIIFVAPNILRLFFRLAGNFTRADGKYPSPTPQRFLPAAIAA